MPSIFVSHTHADAPLSDAIAQLMRDLFGERVGVFSSSNKSLEGSVGPGRDWFKWIIDQVRETDVAFVLLTPSSIQKPWVLWEAGAVAGVAFAGNDGDADHAHVIPISFGLNAPDVPTPFAGTQIVKGTDKADIEKLTNELRDRFAGKLLPKDLSTFGRMQEKAL